MSKIVIIAEWDSEEGMTSVEIVSNKKVKLPFRLVAHIVEELVKVSQR